MLSRAVTCRRCLANWRRLIVGGIGVTSVVCGCLQTTRWAASHLRQLSEGGVGEGGEGGGGGGAGGDDEG